MIMLFFSCEKKGNENQAQSLFDNAFERKVSDYKKQKIKSCLSAVNNEAEVYVDSMIVAEIESYSVENSDRPEKPVRPEYEKRDSQKLKSDPIIPIWKNDKKSN